MGSPLPLRARLRSAGITLIVASASYDIWWTYAGEGTRDLDAMNIFPEFFWYDQEAHFRNAIVGLYTLYDSYEGTLTIKSLIHGLDPEAQKPIWRKYRAVHEAAKKVTYLRHNVFAHRLASKSYDEVFKQAGLKPDHLKKLIADSLVLLTMIADAIGAERPMVSEFVSSETTSLLKLIKAADTG